jgi:hypothetical protein
VDGRGCRSARPGSRPVPDRPASTFNPVTRRLTEEPHAQRMECPPKPCKIKHTI